MQCNHNRSLVLVVALLFLFVLETRSQTLSDDSASAFTSLNVGHHRKWSHREVSPKVFERLNAAAHRLSRPHPFTEAGNREFQQLPLDAARWDETGSFALEKLPTSASPAPASLPGKPSFLPLQSLAQARLSI